MHGQIILDRSTTEHEVLRTESVSSCIWKLAMRPHVNIFWLISFDCCRCYLAVGSDARLVTVLRQSAAHDVCRWSDEEHTSERFDLINSWAACLCHSHILCWFRTLPWSWDWSRNLHKVKFMASGKLIDFDLWISWRSHSLMNQILDCQLVCF